MDSRLKRIMFRAHHMGSNENDILFGGFAEKYLESLSPADVDLFERFIAEADTDLFNWVTNKEPAPENWQGGLLDMIKKYVQEEAAIT